MKKLLLVLLAASCLFTVPGFWQSANAAPVCDESRDTNGNLNGLVPCGRQCKDPAGNIVECGATYCVDQFNGGGVVPCGTICTRAGSLIPLVLPAAAPCAQTVAYQLRCPCQIPHIFILIANIYDYSIKYLALPIAAFMILVGGTMMVLSGINAKWYDRGKDIIKWTCISLLIIFGAWLMVNAILVAIGYPFASVWYSIF